MTFQPKQVMAKVARFGRGRKNTATESIGSGKASDKRFASTAREKSRIFFTQASRLAVLTKNKGKP